MLDQYPPRVTRFSWWYTLRLGAATFLGPVLPTAKPRNLCARSWEATLCMRKGWLSIRVGMPALGFKWWSCGFTCETCWPSVRKQVLIVSNKFFYSSIISFCDSLRNLWLIRCVDVVGFWGGGGPILLALGICTYLVWSKWNKSPLHLPPCLKLRTCAWMSFIEDLSRMWLHITLLHNPGRSTHRTRVSLTKFSITSSFDVSSKVHMPSIYLRKFDIFAFAALAHL